MKATRSQVTKAKQVISSIVKPIYFDAIPLQLMANELTMLGFDATDLEGIYCGHSGRSFARIAENAGLTITWYRMGSGRFEVVAYVS